MNKKYQGKLPPPGMPNFVGPIGDSAFSRPLWWTLNEENQNNVSSKLKEVIELTGLPLKLVAGKQAV